MTPEGKVKKSLIKFLNSIGVNCWYYMPVQNGMGQTGIPDIMATIEGRTFALECKATPKHNPTVRQALQLNKIENAGGISFVIDNESITYFIEAMEDYINRETDHNFEAYLTETAKKVLTRWREKASDVLELSGG